MVARYVNERGLVPSHSHAWFPYATTSNYARRRCAIGPRRIAVLIDVVFFKSLFALNELHI